MCLHSDNELLCINNYHMNLMKTCLYVNIAYIYSLICTLQFRPCMDNYDFENYLTLNVDFRSSCMRLCFQITSKIYFGFKCVIFV